MASACSQVLGLPELLATILERLDAKALFAALQVNKLWADEATRIRWRVDPPTSALAHLHDVERFRYYATKVSSLSWRFHVPWNNRCQEEGDQHPDPKLGTGHFLRLTQLSVHICVDEHEKVFMQYLQPRLGTLDLSAFRPISDSFLMKIEVLCPNLRSFSISGYTDTKQTCDLLRFLNGMPTLTHISLGVRTQDIISRKLYTHLASRPNLLVLGDRSATITSEDVQSICTAIVDPFANLIDLTCLSTSRDFSCLSPLLHDLRSLQLEVLDTSGNIFSAISNCINLASVTVYMPKSSCVPAARLLSVAKNCLHLHLLYIYGPYFSWVDGRSITDDIIGQIATFLPTMTELSLLHMRTSISVTALFHLGEKCAKLERVSLKGNFDLERLGRPTSNPLFPQLRTLTLLGVPIHVTPAQAASMALPQAPKLTKVVIWRDNHDYSSWEL